MSTEDWINMFINKFNESKDYKITDVRDREKLLDELRPKGKWISTKQGDIPITDRCTNCNYKMKWYTNKYNFCPNCGAQMVNDSVINAIRDNNKRYDERPLIDFDGMQYDLSGEE